MVVPFSSFVKASQIVFEKRHFLALFLVIAVSLFLFFLSLPVRNVPGNSFAFQLSILKFEGVLLLATLAALTSLSMVMNLYLLLEQRDARSGVSLVGHGGLGGLGGFVASVFGTASCLTCVSSIFGFLGIGGVLFLVQYRRTITVIAILLLAISLHFTSQKVLGWCEQCRSVSLRDVKRRPLPR